MTPVIIYVLFSAIVFTVVSVAIPRSINNILSDATHKSLAVIEDFTNPQVVSEHVNSTETKVFILNPVDNEHLIGKGFINGVLYYIFQVNEKTSPQGYEVASVADSQVVYDGKNTVEVTKESITQKYKSKVDGQIKENNIERYHYVFHLSDNKIKDYGVIKENIMAYNTAVPISNFFPLFIPMFFK